MLHDRKCCLSDESLFSNGSVPCWSRYYKSVCSKPVTQEIQPWVPIPCLFFAATCKGELEQKLFFAFARFPDLNQVVDGECDLMRLRRQIRKA